MAGKKYDSAMEPDPCPHLVIERGPSNKGVGSWVPEERHRLLWEYLYATRNAWKKWPSHVFIDPFAGPGWIQVEGEKITRDGGAVVAWRALSDTAPFSHMLVGDLESDRGEACAERLRTIGAPVTQFVGPAVETIKEMVASIPPQSLCMACIDPYNLELLSFSLITAIAKLKVDLAINFSTMDLQRNAELEFDPKRARFADLAVVRLVNAPPFFDLATKSAEVLACRDVGIAHVGQHIEPGDAGKSRRTLLQADLLCARMHAQRYQKNYCGSLMRLFE